MKLVGVKVQMVGKKFKCPLHPEKNPSASLFRMKNGATGMMDFHRGRRFYTMPEVYFTYRTGNERQLRGPEGLIWWIRFLRDSEVLEKKTTLSALTKGLPEKQAQVLEGFIELLDCRAIYQKEEETPFTRKFAAEWCWVNENTAKDSIQALAKKGYITKATDMVKDSKGKRYPGPVDLKADRQQKITPEASQEAVGETLGAGQVLSYL